MMMMMMMMMNAKTMGREMVSKKVIRNRVAVLKSRLLLNKRLLLIPTKQLAKKRAAYSEVIEVEIETLKTMSKAILAWDDGNGKESRDPDDLFGMLVADELKSLNQPRNQAPIEALD